ncbi:uncharacterized protein SOCE26_010270 [Sorangium cellulosum]|uniref:Uncharacterized protein n=1 Tax=Sorangium cellulosum TaxID=56 RepID=A0A2L0EK07_SORCE|nr:uncharacterized protein SOCE26_010270 [Sorangium cellulosum]
MCGQAGRAGGLAGAVYGRARAADCPGSYLPPIAAAMPDCNVL